MAVGAAVLLAACALGAGAQLLYWQNTETLFRHTLAVTQNNYLACNNLGCPAFRSQPSVPLKCL